MKLLIRSLKATFLIYLYNTIQHRRTIAHRKSHSEIVENTHSDATLIAMATWVLHDKVCSPLWLADDDDASMIGSASSNLV